MITDGISFFKDSDDSKPFFTPSEQNSMISIFATRIETWKSFAQQDSIVKGFPNVSLTQNSLFQIILLLFNLMYYIQLSFKFSILNSQHCYNIVLLMYCIEFLYAFFKYKKYVSDAAFLLQSLIKCHILGEYISNVIINCSLSQYPN